jgi:predicted unusual protein kinase regulating ubiquinone biosynthesis (AarF/ABC1/UbiB family)
LTLGKVDNNQVPPTEVLRNILVELGPFYVKSGQIISTCPDILSPSYIRVLTALQANVPPVCWAKIEELLLQELQKLLENIFETINHEPIVADSIGQIYRGTLINETEGSGNVNSTDRN